MSTWLSDLRKSNPNLAADYAITGNQSDDNLRRMIKALCMLPGLNDAQDTTRLEAAKRILAHKKRMADKRAKELARANANALLERAC